jgi:hypothetical protein
MGGACSAHGEIVNTMNRPDDGGNKHLFNVGKFLPYFTAQHLRRQPSSSQKKILSKRTSYLVHLIVCSLGTISLIGRVSHEKFKVG